MTNLSRRQILAGTGAVVAAAALPALPAIPAEAAVIFEGTLFEGTCWLPNAETVRWVAKYIYWPGLDGGRWVITDADGDLAATISDVRMAT